MKAKSMKVKLTTVKASKTDNAHKPATRKRKQGNMPQATTGTTFEEMDVDEFLGGGFLKSGGEVDNPGLPGKVPAEKSKGTGNKSAAEEHKAQLEALKLQDPEFYKYLQQADQELLNFGAQEEDSLDEGAEEDEGEEVEGDDSDEEEGVEDVPDVDSGDEEVKPTVAPAKRRKVQSEQPEQPSTSGRSILTEELVGAWIKDAKEKASLPAMEKLVKAYRIACHLGDSDEGLDATMRITSSTIFNTILIFMIKEAGPIFRRMLKLPAGHISCDQVRAAPRWRKLENIVKSFLGNSLHLLGEMTDTAMVVFMLRNLRASVALLVVSERLQRTFMKRALSLFGGAEGAMRVQAILFIRQMAVLLPPPMLSVAMKGVYRAFVLNAKFMSPATLPHLNFMGTCVVELFGLDSAAAYEHAFSYIRQLAVLLRSALSMRTKDAFRQVYCWQTISSLELWAKLLAIHADKQELQPLVYLVAQLLIGTIRLVPTARYFPLRLRCIRALNRLSQARGQFVPVAPLLLEMLQWKGLHTSVKAGGKPPSEAVPQLRAGKTLLASAAFQQSLVEEVFLLLAEHLGQWACSPAFPEMSHLVLLQLRKVGQDSKVERFRAAAKGLSAAIQANSAYVSSARNSLDCSPKDAARLAVFLASDTDQQQAPMRKYAAVLADKAERQRALRDAGDLTVGKSHAASDDMSDSDDADEPQDLLPSRVKARSTATNGVQAEEAGQGSDEEDDEEEDGLEDQVKEYQLSESDDSD